MKRRAILLVDPPPDSLDFMEIVLALSLGLLEPQDFIACRTCGCTNFAACPGGCAWVEPDLCSACAAIHLPPAETK